MPRPNTITVGELRDSLAEYSNDTELYFGAGDLTFYRVKNRSHDTPSLVQIEFNEVYEIKPWRE